MFLKIHRNFFYFMLYWNRICANLEETGWISAGLLTEKVNAEREENDMKKTMTMLLACAITAASLAGCSGADKTQTAAEKETVEETTAAETAAETASEKETSEAVKPDSATEPLRVGSLKGPTTIGLVSLMDKASNGESEGAYEFTMAADASELAAQVVSGDLDIALVPANLASVLYQKTKQGIEVIDINTLGVLYVVASDDSISTMEDLKGKTVYMTGKGTTPEFAMNYLLAENGLGSGDVTMEFKSEAAEVASILKEDPSAIGVLPQPFASAACMQNPELKTVMDLTEQWDLLNKEGNSRMITGVTIVRTGFLEEHEAAVEQFLKDHAESAEYTSAEPEKAAQLVADIGIVEKAAMAQKAMPLCNIVCITGEEMKQALSGYLEVLSGQDAKSIGGTLPGDDFYYLP